MTEEDSAASNNANASNDKEQQQEPTSSSAAAASSSLSTTTTITRTITRTTTQTTAQTSSTTIIITGRRRSDTTRGDRTDAPPPFTTIETDVPSTSLSPSTNVHDAGEVGTGTKTTIGIPSATIGTSSATIGTSTTIGTSATIGTSSATIGTSTTTATTADSLNSQRVFKKCSPNNKLTLYLSSRDLVVSDGKIDRLQGVLLIDPDAIEQRKVYGQVTLTFRYGREDEEVMGLKFCNEAVMCLAQLYPPHPAVQQPDRITPLQEALLRRLGPNAYAFNMEITPLAPPSVQLVPAKEYNGAPIGTSYDVRAYIAHRADEKLHRRSTVRMGIRVVQRAIAPPSPYLFNPGGGRCDGRRAFGADGTITSSVKERHHRRPKITLFGCKSVPLESRPIKQSPIKNNNNKKQQQQQAKSDKQATTLTKTNDENRRPVDNKPSADGDDRLKAEDAANGAELEIRTPTHVTFVENDAETHEGVAKEGRTSIGDDVGKEDKKVADDDDDDNEDGDVTKDADSSTAASCGENESTQMEHIRRMCGGKRPSLAAFLAEVPAPCAIVEKPFLLSDGRIHLEASLDKAIYYHGEEVEVTVHIRNNSNKTIKRIKVFIVQHVDVCMFSNGKFKNVVAMIGNSREDCPIGTNQSLTKTYALVPVKSCTKNWIALEDSYTKVGTNLASSVTCPTATSSTSTSSSTETDERNVFAIYVSYYVKVKLMVSVMGGQLSLKLPFTLMHTCNDYDPSTTLTRVGDPPPPPKKEKSPNGDFPRPIRLELRPVAAEAIEPEKDGT